MCGFVYLQAAGGPPPTQAQPYIVNGGYGQPAQAQAQAAYAGAYGGYNAPGSGGGWVGQQVGPAASCA